MAIETEEDAFNALMQKSKQKKERHAQKQLTGGEWSG